MNTSNTPSAQIPALQGGLGLWGMGLGLGAMNWGLGSACGGRTEWSMCRRWDGFAGGCARLRPRRGCPCVLSARSSRCCLWHSMRGKAVGPQMSTRHEMRVGRGLAELSSKSRGLLPCVFSCFQACVCIRQRNRTNSGKKTQSDVYGRNRLGVRRSSGHRQAETLCLRCCLSERCD